MGWWAVPRCKQRHEMVVSVLLAMKPRKGWGDNDFCVGRFPGCEAIRSICAKNGDHCQVVFLAVMNGGIGESEWGRLLAQSGLRTVESK